MDRYLVVVSEWDSDASSQAPDGNPVSVLPLREALDFEIALDPGNPRGYTSTKKRMLKLVPIALKSDTHPYNLAKRVDNIMAVWSDEQLSFYVSGITPELLAHDPNIVTWQADGATITPVPNQPEVVLQWSSTGMKTVTANVMRNSLVAKVDVPEVGILPEEVVILVAPVETALALSYVKEAQTWASQFGDNEGIDEANAIQDSFWNSLIASDVLADTIMTLVVTTAHECSNRAEGGLALDSCMDLHNNFEGAMVDHTTWGGLPDRALIKPALKAKLQSGGLRVINKSDWMLIKSVTRKKFF